MPTPLGRPRPPHLHPAEHILIAHQRRDIGTCHCGWDQLGASHPRHQVDMLIAAGLLTEQPPAPPPD